MPIEIPVGLVSDIIDVLAAIVVGYGAVEAFYRVVIQPLFFTTGRGHYERARADLGRKLLVGLEFELGADILQTAVSPTWNHIGIVASIVVIRTVLNLVLRREIEHLEARIGEESSDRT